METKTQLCRILSAIYVYKKSLIGNCTLNVPQCKFFFCMYLGHKNSMLCCAFNLSWEISFYIKSKLYFITYMCISRSNGFFFESFSINLSNTFLHKRLSEMKVFYKHIKFIHQLLSKTIFLLI